jgi:hypothetical protein
MRYVVARRLGRRGEGLGNVDGQGKMTEAVGCENRLYTLFCAKPTCKESIAATAFSAAVVGCEGMLVIATAGQAALSSGRPFRCTSR